MLVTDKDKKSFDAIRKLTKVNLVPQELDPEPRKRARFPRKTLSTDSWKAPRKPEDPFFSQPYVPDRSFGKKSAILLFGEPTDSGPINSPLSSMTDSRA